MPGTHCPFLWLLPSGKPDTDFGAGAGNAPRQGRRAQGFVSCVLPKRHRGDAHTLFLTLPRGDVLHQTPPRTPSPIPKDPRELCWPKK